jgi:hypothetical protein
MSELKFQIWKIMNKLFYFRDRVITLENETKFIIASF